MIFRMVKTVATAILAFLVLASIYVSVPTLRYAISDWYFRFSAPDFDWRPARIAPRTQSEVIEEYTQHGYGLRCYGNLEPRETIGKADYLCSALIRNAWDQVPARRVTFFFTAGELSHVRLAFPGTSFDELQAWLATHMHTAKRLDKLPGARFRPDLYGKPLMVWLTDGGIVTSSAENTFGKELILLWSSRAELSVPLPSPADRILQPVS